MVLDFSSVTPKNETSGFMDTIYGLTGDTLTYIYRTDPTTVTVTAVAKCSSDITLTVTALTDGYQIDIPWTTVSTCAGNGFIHRVPVEIKDSTGRQIYLTAIFVDRDTYNHLYVSPGEVASYLGLERLDSDQYWRLVVMIIDKMEYVDRISNGTWNGRTKTWTQYFDMKPWKSGLIWFMGAPLHLQHRCIRDLLKFEVFRGSGYDDILPELREGRGSGDYWIDRVKGQVYWQHFWWFMGGKEFKITYSYGCDDLPPYVRELTLLLVARDVLVNERRITQLPASDNLSIARQLDWMDKRIRELEGVLKAWRVLTD